MTLVSLLTPFWTAKSQISVVSTIPNGLHLVAKGNRQAVLF